MSAQKKATKRSWKLDGAWAGAWRTFAVIGVLGLAGSAAGWATDPRRFAFSWMFAFVTCLSVALGAMFFVLIQRLTSAGWSVTVRRTAEFFSYGVLALIPMFIPVLMSMGHLFPWLGEGQKAATPAEHGSIHLISPAYAQDHAAPAAPKTLAAAASPVAAPGAAAASPGSAAAPAAVGSAAALAAAASAVALPTPPSPASVPAPPEVAGAPAEPPSVGARAYGHEGPASARAHAEHEAHALTHTELMAKKSAYLNKNFFYVRACLYFLIWTVLAVRLFGYSTAQDVSKDPHLTVRAQAFAPPATFLFALSLTFAAFDWIMSLEPTWFSTIFGVYFFAASVVSSYALLILVTLALRKSGPLDGAVTVEHYHDLGKLMFGFLVFWAYIGFSQFMLIWYAALPEETTFYHNRWDHDPWSKVSLALLLGHFVLPFFWTISRNFKRDLGRLQIGAAIILVMHVVDMYWLVMPNYLLGQDGFAFSWIDLSCLCAIAGIYGAFVFHRMTKFSIVPVGDPRLERSLHFQNA